MFSDCKTLDFLELLANKFPYAKFSVAVSPSQKPHLWFKNYFLEITALIK